MKLLTRRELECLHWASLGKTSWEIGSILGITERTVNFHIRNACDKLQVRGRQAAITAAHYAGLFPKEPVQRPFASESKNCSADSRGKSSAGPMTKPSTNPVVDNQTCA